MNRRQLLQSILRSPLAAAIPRNLLRATAAGLAARLGAQTSPNPVSTENSKTGTTQWQLTKPVLFTDRDPATFSSRPIEGYASVTSVNLGGKISFCVSTPSPTFSIDIYRMGWYQGLGGRLMMSQTGIAGHQYAVPAPGAASGGLLVECTWPAAWTLTIPATWVSGVYLAKLTATSTGKQSYIVFVVRDDARNSDIYFQQSVTTYQAYNGWGGESYYGYNCHPPNTASRNAFRVSFNRPYFAAHLGSAQAQGTTPYATGAGHLFSNFPPDTQYVPAWEYNLIRWIEKNGYDVTYCTNIDTHTNLDAILGRKIFLSTGHDEYWSREMRFNVELARDAGIDVAFLSGNIVYNQVRLEPDASANPNRRMVCYPDGPPSPDPLNAAINNGTAASSDRFPCPNYSGAFLWQGWSESSLTSTGLACTFAQGDIAVRRANDWIFTGSGAVNGAVMHGLSGYEVDDVSGDFGAVAPWTPPQRRLLGKGTFVSPNTGQPAGAMQAYTAESGATVFSAGSIQFAWGLDPYVITGAQRPSGASQGADPIAQAITANLLKHAVKANGGSVTILRPNPTAANGYVALPNSVARTVSGKSRFVTGNFAPNGLPTLFEYGGAIAPSQFYQADGQGGISTYGGAYLGFRKTWRAYSGNFTGGPYTDIMLFEARLNLIYFFKTLGGAEFNQVNSNPSYLAYPAVGPFVTGKFVPGPYTDLLFYDTIRGVVQLYTTNGLGGLTPSYQLNLGYAKTYRFFSGNFSASAFSGIAFFDPYQGSLVFCSTDGQGGLTQLGPTITGLSQSLQIIPCKFSANPTTDLIFFDPLAGQTRFYTTDGLGGIQPVGGIVTSWKDTWQVIPLAPNANGMTDLVFYDRFAQPF